MPVAVDAMGGDNAPATIVAGARQAFEEFGVPVVLVGRADELGDVGGVSVVDAREVIEMGAEPASSVRRRKDSSIVRGAELVRDGEAKALLSAGNTGAAMAASLLRMGRIRKVARPAIAVPLPVFGSTPTTLLDCGANADCQSDWLVQFARLGATYNRVRFDVKRPRVGILTIGEEAGKGNEFVKATVAEMEATDWGPDIEYIGNIEGGDLMTGVADVAVCDGFTGNIVLKSLEGLMTIARREVAAALESTAEGRQASPVVRSLVDPVFATLDSAQTGAAMLLGVRGVSMISHGSASADTIARAIRTASELADADVVDRLRQALDLPS